MNKRYRQAPLVGVVSFHAVVLLAGWATAQAVERPGRIDCGAGFTAVLRERDDTQPAGGDYFEVYAESLNSVPLVVTLTAGMRLDPDSSRARLTNKGRAWVDVFSLYIEKNGERSEEHRLEMIEGSVLRSAVTSIHGGLSHVTYQTSYTPENTCSVRGRLWGLRAHG